MKVAVTIAGQLRDYKINTLNHIKHLIEPTSADVFVYACSKNTIHTTGPNITQKYNVTTTETAAQIKEDVSQIYGSHLKRVEVDEQENLDTGDFGTLGYFRKRMQNQMDNMRAAYVLARDFDDYDVIVRVRPDNSMFLSPVLISNINITKGRVYTTIYPSGHQDPWFFSFSHPDTFDIYSSFRYLEGFDDSRTDNNFECPEVALLKFLESQNIQVSFFPSVCLPFYQHDKTKKITDFPFRNKEAKLINANAQLVDQVS